MRLRALLVSLAVAATTTVVLHATPAKAAVIPLSLQIINYNPYPQQQLLGRVDGTITYSGTSVSYSLTFCRQSSYQLPYMRINANSSYIGGVKYATFITNVYPPYSGYSQTQPCYAQTGTVNSGFSFAPLNNVEYILYGSTFIGQNHTIFSQDRIHYGPF